MLSLYGRASTLEVNAVVGPDAYTAVRADECKAKRGVHAMQNKAVSPHMSKHANSSVTRGRDSRMHCRERGGREVMGGGWG